MMKSRPGELLLIVSAFGILAYFAFGLLFAMPYRLIYFTWDESGTTFVVDPPPAPLTPAEFPVVDTAHPEIGQVQPGDRLLSVNGNPIRFDDFLFRFGWPQDSYTYRLEREGAEYTAVVPNGPPDLADMFARWSVALIGLAMSGLAATSLLANRSKSRGEVRFFATVFFAMAIMFVADRGIRINWPLSLTTTALLVPPIAVAYLHIGFLVGEIRGRLVSIGLAILYLASFILSFLTFQGVLSLSTNFMEGFLQYVDNSLLSYLILGISLVAMPLVLIVRGILSKGALRQKSLIVGLLCIIPGIPFLTLDIIPFFLGLGAIYRDAILFLFILVPAAFCIVLLRYQFLNLDRLLSRSTVFIALMAAIIVIYAVVDLISPDISQRDMILLFGLTLLGIGVFWLLALWIPRIGDTVIFGPAARDAEVRHKITASLSTATSLREVTAIAINEVCGLLNLDGGLAIVAQPDGQSRIVGKYGQVNAQSGQPCEFPRTIISLKQLQPELAVWQCFPWATAFTAVKNRGGTLGYLIYGTRHTGEEGLNSREVDLLQEIAQLSAVAWENVWLLEQQVRARRRLFERRKADEIQLVADLHDGPIQVIEAALKGLQDLSRSSGEQQDSKGKVENTTRMLEDGLKSLRQIRTALRPKILREDTEIVVSALVTEFRMRNPGVELQIETRGLAEGLWPSLDLLSKDAVFYVLRGALLNARKHASGSSVNIVAEQRGDSFHLTITDKGAGFEASRPLDRLECESNGYDSLVSFFDHAELAGGTLDIRAKSTNGGTKVMLSVPMHPERRGVLAYALAADPI